MSFLRSLLKSPKGIQRTTNLWPPLVGAGVRITEIADDWSYARIELKLRFWSANMHGTAFGGTLYGMTDVMVGTLISHYLGPKYEGWTRTGTFQYLSPGRDGAYMEVKISEELGDWIRQTVAEDGYANVPYTAVIYNRDGSVVGIGQQDLHVRPRGGGKRAEAPRQAREPRGLVLEALTTSLVWRFFKEDTAVLTRLMSEQRRIPAPEDQMRHVVAAIVAEGHATREQLAELQVPEEYLPES